MYLGCPQSRSQDGNIWHHYNGRNPALVAVILVMLMPGSWRWGAVSAMKTSPALPENALVVLGFRWSGPAASRALLPRGRSAANRLDLMAVRGLS